MISKFINCVSYSKEYNNNKKNNKNNYDKTLETVPASFREFLYDLHLEQLEQM